MKNLSTTIERIRELLDDTSSTDTLTEELNSFHSADLADILQELKEEERLECFKLIDVEKASEIIEYLPPQLQVEILSAIDQEHASEIITMLPHDAAADVLGDMEEDETTVIFKNKYLNAHALIRVWPDSKFKSATEALKDTLSRLKADADYSEAIWRRQKCSISSFKSTLLLPDENAQGWGACIPLPQKKGYLSLLSYIFHIHLLEIVLHTFHE